MTAIVILMQVLNVFVWIPLKSVDPLPLLAFFDFPILWS